MVNILWFMGASILLVSMVVSILMGVMQFDFLGWMVIIVVSAFFLDSVLSLVDKLLKINRYTKRTN